MLKFLIRQIGLKELSYGPAAPAAASLPYWKDDPAREADSTDLPAELLKTARLVHPHQGLSSMLKRFKYCLRGLAYAHPTAEWFRFLRSQGLHELARKQPHLFHKLQRPYLNRTFSTRQRLDALQQHYRFVLDRFSPSALTEIHQGEGLLLADVGVQGQEGLGLYLGNSAWGQKEGDLILTLREQGSRKVLFSLSFSVLEFAQIFIGGLQGRKSLDKDLVVSVTRGLHGLRPKALLLFALQQLAEIWGIHRLRAVSDDLQVYRHPQKRRTIQACYDEFWTESGGVPAADGVFDLPGRFCPKDPAAIKANKRKMYQRRYEMLEGLASQIRFRMSSSQSA